MPYQWLVESESRGEVIQHQVDLSDWNFNGSCTCEHFDLRIRPELEVTGIKNVEPDNDSRCKHIKYLREVVMNTILDDHSGPQEILNRKRIYEAPAAKEEKR